MNRKSHNFDYLKKEFYIMRMEHWSIKGISKMADIMGKVWKNHERND